MSETNGRARALRTLAAKSSVLSKAILEVAADELDSLQTELDTYKAAYDDLECCIKGALGAFTGIPPIVKTSLWNGIHIAKQTLEGGAG